MKLNKKVFEPTKKELQIAIKKSESIIEDLEYKIGHSYKFIIKSLNDGSMYENNDVCSILIEMKKLKHLRSVLLSL